MASSSAETFRPPFEAGSRGYARPDDLQPFHLEAETYVERDNQDLVESIEAHGFYDDERLTVTPDGTIIKGHRRLDGAEQNGLERVPIEVVDVDPNSPEAVIMFLSSNQYRDKTPGERINEAQHWESVLQEAADSADSPDLVNRQRRGVREAAADRAGLGRESYRKGKKVKEVAESGDPIAQAAWNKLENDEESIHGAYTTVMDSLQDDEEEESESDTESSEPDDTLDESDERPEDSEESTESKDVDETDAPEEDGEDEPTETNGTADEPPTVGEPDPREHDGSGPAAEDEPAEIEGEAVFADNPGTTEEQQENREELIDQARETREQDSSSFTPLSEVEEYDDADHPGGSASERQLRARLRQKDSRIDELETIVRRFIQAVDNEDPEAVRATAEEAEGLVDA